jgi:hypothetical protein
MPLTQALRDAKKEGVVKSHKKKKKEKGREGFVFLLFFPALPARFSVLLPPFSVLRAPEVSVSATAQPAAPRLLISALPSFLDKLPTRDPISAGNSYLPQLPTYSPTPGPKQQVSTVYTDLHSVDIAVQHLKVSWCPRFENFSAELVLAVADVLYWIEFR